MLGPIIISARHFRAVCVGARVARAGRDVEMRQGRKLGCPFDAQEGQDSRGYRI